MCLRSTPSSIATILSIARRERSFSESVLNSTLMRASVSKAWRNIKYFASLLTRVFCHFVPIRIAPISVRRVCESMSKKRVVPAIRGETRAAVCFAMSF